LFYQIKGCIKIYNEFVLDVKFTYLYSIKPKGGGTPYTESLTSYITRIATAHCLTPGELINNILARQLNKDYIKRSATFGGNRFYDGARYLNGLSKTSREIISILQELTGRSDLSCLALNNWTNVISPRTLLKENLSWCPMCIKEIQDKRDIYYPLLWYLKDVNQCTLHNITLSTHCPTCEEKIPILHRKMVNGYCPYCNASLTTYQTHGSVIMKEFDNFIIEEIKYLIQHSPNISYVFEKGFVNKRMKLLISHATSGNPADLRGKIGIPKVTFYGWIRENRLPQLDSLIKICYSMGISLFNLLNQEFTEPVSLRQTPLNPSNKVSKSKRKLNYDQIQNQLIMLLTQDPPISMEEAAKKININKRTIYLNLPDLAKQISASKIQ
jgi:hypothetical protein